MKPNSVDQNRVIRHAIWGAVTLGIAGFATGAFICLHYKLPIPPLFITEMGMLVGGCIGALCALTRTEKKILPSALALSGTTLVALGFGIEPLHAAGASLAVAALTWTSMDSSAPESAAPWRNL